MVVDGGGSLLTCYRAISKEEVCISLVTIHH
uniref:Uncharacterized protein n=1 Tax=Arundo donax TaxID=35708 RepID=A0A0A9AMY9_ARUDO